MMNSTYRRTQSLARNLAVALATGTCAIALTMPLATTAHAQQVNASLSGKITGGATSVTAVEVNTGARRTSNVGADGSYSFASLAPGNYRLDITTPDGVRSTDVFRLTVAQDAALDIDLSDMSITAPAPTAEAAPTGAATSADTGDAAGTIIVTANLIRTMEAGEVGATVTQRQIETLPQNSRNFLSFADLAPGVQIKTGDNGNVAIQGGAQGSSTTNVFIDGVGQKDYVLKNGITGQDSSQGNPFPQLAIGEYRVISSNYKAEFDQVSSVAITAATRSGTNEFHGQAFVDYTDQSLRTRTPLEKQPGNSKVKTQDMQFGAALGGPIIQDKMHFFVTYEGKRQQRPTDITPGGEYTVADYPAEYQDLFGAYSRDFNEDLFFGKIDFSPTPDDLIEASIKVRKETGEDGFGGQNSYSRLSNINNDEKRGLLKWEHTADNWINEFRATYEDSSWAPTPASFGNSYEYQTANYAFLLGAGSSLSYQDKGQKGYGLQDDFTYTGIDNHTFKVGVKAKWVKLSTLERNFTNPLYSYNVDYGDSGFNDTTPYKLTFGVPVDGFGDGSVTSKNFQLGLYAQDDWEVTDRLTLNLGLRWDYEETPAYLNFVTPSDAVDAVTNFANLANADYNIGDFISTGSNRHPFKGAFQPRIGFSYALDENHDWTVFGGYGRSYDRNQFDFLQTEIASGSWKVLNFNFDNNDPDRACAGCIAWDPAYLTQAGRDALAAGTTGGGRELRFISNDLKMPRSDQFSLGLRGRMGQWRPEIGYSHIASRDGFAWLLGNRLADGSFFQPGTNWGPPWGGSPDGYGSILLGVNGIETNADSAHFKLAKDYSRSSPWSLAVTYTFTLAEENRKFGESYSLDYPSLADYPVLRSAGVSKHQLVAAGSVDIPFGFTLSSKITLRSPPYVTGVAGDSDANRHYVVTEGDNKHPFIVGDLWAYRQVDLAIAKRVPMPMISPDTALKLRLDVLNLFNTDNFTSYNGDANSASFGQVNSLTMGGNPPLTMKLSAGIEF